MDKLPKYKLNLSFTDNAKEFIENRLNIYANNSKEINNEEKFRRIFKPNKFYFSYMSYSGKSKGDPSYKIIITDENKNLLSLFDENIIIINGIQKSKEKFLITSIKLKNNKYQNQAHEKEVYLKFYTSPDHSFYNVGFDQDILDELKEKSNPGKKFQQRISDWEKYLNKCEEITKRKNFIVDYVNYLDYIHDGKLEFTLTSEITKEQKEKIKNAVGERISLYEHSAKDVRKNSSIDYIKIGNIVEFNSTNNRLIVEMNDKIYNRIAKEELRFNSQGSLEYTPGGNLAEIHRKMNGIKKLRKGDFSNSNLAHFLFDINKAEMSSDSEELKSDDYYNKQLNKKQKKAVNKIINTNDITLIKGPPGTGKTTVITEACYQLARKNKSILLSSQTNLAVDNVLAKMKTIIRDGVPVYPLRYGSISAIETEGEEFAEDRAVTTWMKNSAELAYNKLNEKIQKRKSLESIAEKEEKIKKYITKLKKKNSLENNLADRKKELKEINSMEKLTDIITSIENNYQKLIKLEKLNKKIKRKENKLNEHINNLDKLKEKLSYLNDNIDHLEKKIKNYLLYKKDIKNNKIDFKEMLNNNINFELKDYNLNLNSFNKNLYNNYLAENDFKEIWPKVKKKIESELEDIFNSIEEYDELKDLNFDLKALYDLTKDLLKEIKNEQIEGDITAGFTTGANNELLKYFNTYRGNIIKPAQSTYIKISFKVKEMCEKNKYKKAWYNLQETKFKLNKSIENINKFFNNYQNIQEKPLNYLEDRLDNFLLEEITNLNRKKEVKLQNKKEERDNLEDKIRKITKLKKNVENNIESLNTKKDNLAKYLYNNEKLEILAESNNPESLLENNWKEKYNKSKEKLQLKLDNLDLTENDIASRKKETKKDINNIKTNLDTISEECNDYQKWWKNNILEQAYFKNLFKDNLPLDPKANYLKKILNKIKEDLKSYQEYKNYEERYSDLVNDWYQANKNINEESFALKELYFKRVNLVGATCSKTESKDFVKNYDEFDYVIIDEVSKATVPELILPLLKGKKVILIGDDKQLPPLVNFQAENELKERDEYSEKDLKHLKKSLFSEMWKQAPAEMKIMLNKQYRMHDQIMNVINQFYQEKLENGIKKQELNRKHNLDLSYLNKKQHTAWVQIPEKDKYREVYMNPSYKNLEEVNIIDNILNDIDQIRKDRENYEQKIGVITFYSAQDRELKKLRHKYSQLDIRTGTVDRFQGMERDIIIISMVRNNDRGNLGFTKRAERINVGLSRAKNLLIMVGSTKFFCDVNRDDKSRKIFTNVAKEIDKTGGMIDVSSIYY